MGEENRLLVTSIVILVLVAVFFSVGVVLITRSDLTLTQDNPLNHGNTGLEQECTELTHLAHQAFSDGRIDEALHALAFVESLSCGDEFLLRGAELYRAMNMPQGAVRLMETLVKKDPENGRIQNILAWSLFESGHPDSALSVLHRAQNKRGMEGATVRSLAWLAVALKKPSIAGELFLQALDFDPTDTELWRALSQVSLQSGDIIGARRAAQEAIRLEPASCGAHLARAWAAEAAGDSAQAARSFISALTHCPDDNRVIFEIGRFHFRAGRAAQAVPFLAQATQRQSCPLDWLLMLGRAQVRAGLTQEARQTFILAGTRPDADFQPFLECARIERNARNYKKARRLALKAKAIAPENPTVDYFLKHLPRTASP